jgi:rod shape-determining protein MreC
MKQLFLERSSPRNQAFFLCLISLILFVVDGKSTVLKPVRQAVGSLVEPIIWLAVLPRRIAEQGSSFFEPRDQQRLELFEQRRLSEMLQARQLKFEALLLENNRLRALLGSSAKVSDLVLIAEVIGISPDPDQHYVMVDKGLNHGVFVGQGVIDATGLVGQVAESTANLSKVLLVTDQSHAVPVLSIRTASQLIVEGTGNRNLLSMRHVSESLDLKVGDLLVTSGLGQRFPSGYPVAEIARYQFAPGASFAEVLVKPLSRLQTLDHVLLVFDSAEHLTLDSAVEAVVPADG